MQDNYVSLWACALWQITVSKELKSWKKGVRINMSRRNFSSKKRNISDCFDTFFEEQKRNWQLLFNSFCTRCCWIIVWREFLKEASLNFLPRKLPGETLCKLVQILPPKVLVYILLMICYKPWKLKKNELYQPTR